MAGVYPGSESGTCFRTNRSCRLGLAHQGMKSRSCGLVQRIGAADSATPHPDPSGGQAPRLAKSSTALHFLIPPWTIGLQFGTFRRWRAGIEVDWRAHPGSESGMCFRRNRSCRLAPAHEGMKIGCIGWWESSSVIATTRTSPLDSRLRGNDEMSGGSLSRIGVRDMLSYQSLVPAGAGTPRYEKPELWFGTENWHGGFCHAPPRPQRGTSPSPREVFDRATFSHSAIDHRSTIRHVSPVESRHRG